MDSFYTIGFSTQFYTLWHVVRTKNYTELNGEYHHTSNTTSFRYVRNLTKSEDSAIEKALWLTGQDEILVDETLKGVSSRSFERNSYVHQDIDSNVFPFGRCVGEYISESNDVYQLERVLNYGGSVGPGEQHNSFKCRRRRALARKRLVELGELFRVDYVTDIWSEAAERFVESKMKYMTKVNYLHKIKCETSEHYHEDGSKVFLNLRKVKTAYYESQFGLVWIITYQNENEQTYIYKGSSCPDISDDKFTKVRATIKNGEYKGVKQNLIQRVKVLEYENI